MKNRRFYIRAICLLLCITMLIQTVPSLATGTAQAIVTYISDVKIIYAASLDEAKGKVPKGYVLYDKDINSGTESTKVYICYQTTTEVTDAITDLRVMNENGGFDRGTFNDKMDQALKSLDAQAQGIHNALVKEFVPNLKAGLPGAVYAYEQLNVFMFDDKNHLGDYIKEGKLTKDDISKMLLVCHNTVISAVLSLIVQGLQRPKGSDWLDNLEKLDPADYENNRGIQEKYADIINKIQGPLNDFSDAYNIMVYTDEVRDSMSTEQLDQFSEDLANEDTVKWWYALWEILNAHPLKGDSKLTAESVLVEFNLGESVANYKICMLIDSLTEGQRALLSLVGPINLIFNDIFTEEEKQKALKDLESLKEECGTVPLWVGVDNDIFTSEVGITSVAFDEMVTSSNYDIFTGENMTMEKTTEDYVSLVTNYCTLVSASVAVFTSSAMLLRGYTGSFIVFRALSKVGLCLAKSLLGTLFSYAPIVIVSLCLLATLIIYIIKEIQAGKPPAHDRTTIPKYMVDSVTDKNGAQKYEIYTRINNVQSDAALKAGNEDWADITNFSGSDINANTGYYWSAIYFSKNESVGNPIRADFQVAEIAKDISGFIPLREFNKLSEAANLNAADRYNESLPSIYLYYRSEKLPENHTVYKYIRSLSVVNVSRLDPKDPENYIFTVDEATNVAKKDLTEMGMYVIDYNFSNDPNVVSMIGWNGTDEAAHALKDIRWVYESSVGRAGCGVFGSLSYGNLGVINGWSLFICRGDQNPASPATSLRLLEYGKDPSKEFGISINSSGKGANIDTSDEIDYQTGWEPANEFTGGAAIPMGTKNAQLYFLPEETYTSGPDYLAGIKTDTYITNFGHSYVRENCNHKDLWNNDYDTYRKYKETAHGEHFFTDAVLKTKCNSYGLSYSDKHDYCEAHPDCPYMKWEPTDLLRPHTVLSIKYNLTKNPYRAIYGVASRTTANNEKRNSFAQYDGFGYVLAPVEVTCSMSQVTIVDFPYTKFIESRRSITNKTHVLEDSPYHSKGIVVNMDVTQTVFTDLNQYFYEEVASKWNCLYVTGYCAYREPLTTEDVILSNERLSDEDIPDGFTELTYIGGDGTTYASLAPITGGTELKYRNFSTYITADLYGEEKLYAYIRNEIIIDNKPTSYKPGEGTYVSNLFLVSKEKLRVTSLLSQNEDAECEDISYGMLETSLINKGATTTYTENIGTDFYSGGKDSANTVFLGLSRTNDPFYAIRDIRFHVCNKNETPQKEMEVTLKINGKEQKVIYTLVDGVSITSKADLDCKKELNSKEMETWVEDELYEERQAYIYVTYNSIAFPNPITDVKVESWCTFGSNEPLLDFSGNTLYTVQKQSDTNLHIRNAWLEEGNSICFVREGSQGRFVSEMDIRYGDDKWSVVSSLIKDGYSVVDHDMNKNAAGDHIYIGVKYTDDENNAIRNLLTMHKKNPYVAYSVTDEGHIYIQVADVDLNKGAGGKYIYLYYTKDARAGEPIYEITGSSDIKNYSDGTYAYTTVKRLWDYEYANLNAGTTFFTADIYLIMQRKSNVGKYISDVEVVYAWSRSGAIEKLAELGYLDFVDKDLNDNTGSSQYIYLGYKRTNDPDKAIRGLITSYFSKPDLKFNDVTYYRVSEVDLNRHCLSFSKDIFLYYTKDSKAGDPIVDLYTSDFPVSRKKDAKGYHNTVGTSSNRESSTSGHMDLNDGAGGDYIYLVMISTPKPSIISSMFGNGSWVAIVTSASCLVGFGVLYIFWKRKKSKNTLVSSID